MKRIIPIIAIILIVAGGCGMKEASEQKTVVFETNMGSFEVTLDTEKAPITTENFLNYVESGFYDNLIFHRVISDFMIQGGGFDAQMVQKPTNAPIKNEATNGLLNNKYTIAMARTGVVDSATSQFFINVADNDFLNHKGTDPRVYGYAVFGMVTDGQETVDKIASVDVAENQMGEKSEPVEKVIITKAYVK